MKNAKGINVFQDVIHSIYDIKNVVSFTKKKGKGYFSFLCMLALVIVLFTSIIPTFRVLTQLHGVETIITMGIPDFTYENKELTLDYFKCDIKENKAHIFMVDTSRELDNIILEDHNAGFIADKSHFAYKNSGGEIISKYYSEILGDTKISRQWFLDHIYLIYIFLILVVVFSWLFVFISLLFTTFIIGCIILLINKFFVKNKTLKWMDFLNISLYCLSVSCIAKGILSCFNYVLYLSPWCWFSFIQWPLTGILIFFAFKEFKNNNKMVDKLEEFENEEDKIDAELGFSEEDKKYRDELKETAKKMKRELREQIAKSKKE